MITILGPNVLGIVGFVSEKWVPCRLLYFPRRKKVHGHHYHLLSHNSFPKRNVTKGLAAGNRDSANVLIYSRIQNDGPEKIVHVKSGVLLLVLRRRWLSRNIGGG